MSRLSITSKLYLGFLGLLVGTLVFLGAASALWFLGRESANLDQFLEAEVRGVSNRLEGLVEGLSLGGTEEPLEVGEALRSDLSAYLSQRLNRPVPYKTTLVIFDSQGKVLARSNSALDLNAPFPPLVPGQVRIEDVRERGPAYRVITASYPLGNGQAYLRVACLLTSLDAPLASFLTSLLLVLGGSLVLFSVLGAGLMGLTLRPVREMAVAAGQISEQNLDSRIPLPPGNDDLSRLAGTLNGLLSRLETDYAFQERLVGELTHQLKTPLTILRGRNELALTTRHDVEDLRELVEDNLSDIDSIVNLLNTLLELARLDSRIERPRTTELDLGHLVLQVGEELEPLWQSKDLEFFAQGDQTTVAADPEALKQVLTNLYDNAWKYSPPGTRVSTLWKAVPGSGVTLTVSNQGPPVPEEDRELIFKRFFRSSSSDSDLPGAGLGLSIVRSLVGLHGGTVRVVDPPGGGAGFEVFLPYGSSR